MVSARAESRGEEDWTQAGTHHAYRSAAIHKTRTPDKHTTPPAGFAANGASVAKLSRCKKVTRIQKRSIRLLTGFRALLGKEKAEALSASLNDHFTSTLCVWRKSIRDRAKTTVRLMRRIYAGSKKPMLCCSG
jgi:hypothetical protein